MLLIGQSFFRMTEYVDMLHEHIEAPTVVEKGRYMAPTVS